SLQVACLIFFFQAEDGIRDFHVTGVQTCALPILPAPAPPPTLPDSLPSVYHATPSCHSGPRSPGRPARAARCGPGGTRSGDRYRSEERRVGKECRSRVATDHYKKRNESAKQGSGI